MLQVQYTRWLYVLIQNDGLAIDMVSSWFNFFVNMRKRSMINIYKIFEMTLSAHWPSNCEAFSITILIVPPHKSLIISCYLWFNDLWSFDEYILTQGITGSELKVFIFVEAQLQQQHLHILRLDQSWGSGKFDQSPQWDVLRTPCTLPWLESA